MTDLYQRSFAGGEIAPELYARSDQTKYQTGLRECTNFYVRKSGGVSNRAGTQFIGEANLNPSDPSVDGGHNFQLYRLIPFVFSNDQSYVLEFSQHAIRVIKNGAYVQVNPVNYDPNRQYLPGESTTFNGVNYVARDGRKGQQPDISSPEWTRLFGRIFQYPTVWKEDWLYDLKYHQVNDIMYVASHFVDFMKIIRAADDRWYIQFVDQDADWVQNAPPYLAATNVTVTKYSNGSMNYSYQIRAINNEGHESYSGAFGSITGAPAPTTSTPIDLSWTGRSDAIEYRIYRGVGSGWGFIGKATATTFRDIYADPDAGDSPAEYILKKQSPPIDADGIPATVGMFQQRLVIGQLNNDKERIVLSNTGDYERFSTHQNPQDDDAIDFVLAAKRFSRIFHICDLGAPIIFTENGEWILKGDVNGTVTPTAINPNRRSDNGAAEFVRPVEIDDTLIYAQSRGNVVRDFSYQQETDGYKGNDLTVFATHLFEGKRILEIEYQQNPDSIVWVLLDSGELLGLSYLREHAIWGWHRHVTDGPITHICVIPEGNTDSLYLMVDRSSYNGTLHCVERMAQRVDDDPERMYFVDSGLSFNGLATSTSPGVMLNPIGTISTPITADDIATLSATGNIFSTTDVGNAIVIYRFDDDHVEVHDKIQLNIVAYIDASHVSVTPNRDVPVWAIGQLTTDYSRAFDTFSGMRHLDGKHVAILADGNVVSDGVNEPLYQVFDGSVTLDRAASFAHIGLPYQSRLETLDVDVPGSVQTLRPKPKLSSYISLVVKKTPVLMVGTSFSRLTETKIREEEDMGEPTRAKTGFIDINVDAAWDEETRACVVQDQPLPATILTVMPGIQIAKE